MDFPFQEIPDLNPIFCQKQAGCNDVTARATVILTMRIYSSGGGAEPGDTIDSGRSRGSTLPEFS